MSSFRPSKKAAPRGYVPGLGRGAAGFTTRSDIGPMSSSAAAGAGGTAQEDNSAVGGSRSAEVRAAKMMQRKHQQEQQQQDQSQVGGVSSNYSSPFGVAPRGYVAGSGRGAGFKPDENDNPSDGGPTGIRNNGSASSKGSNAEGGGKYSNPYDDEDDEADAIYNAIDERMNAKKRKNRNNGDGEENPTQQSNSNNNNIQKNFLSTNNIGKQFRELKQQLATVTEDEWASIPDVGDYSLRYKQKRRQDTFTPITDSLLEARSKVNEDATASNTNATLAATTQIQSGTTSGFKSVTNMSGLAEARNTVLGMSLDRMSAAADSSSGQTTIDPQGYLTSLSNKKIANSTEIGDINKARLLLKSVRDTNPKHAPGWIASARVEEAAGKINQARKLIQEGCEICKTNEDIWLEAARLHPQDVAKTILASAVRHIPRAVNIFIRAAEFEHHDETKKAILRKGLELNPTSVLLWKNAIELEDAEDAKILLSVAVEKVPSCVEMWLALSKLESYENARKVLNQARRALPIERSIWIAAAKLEESQNHNDMVDKIIQKAVSSLYKHDAVISRETWLKEAEVAEKAHAPLTSSSIIKHTISIGVDVEDRQRTWADDANSALSKNAIITARAILAHSLSIFPSKRSLWMQAVELERKHGDPKSLDEVLEAASERLPTQEIFWLVRAKEKWVGGDVESSREILTKAFAANPNSEAVWLAAAKLEWETGEIDRARVLFQRARERASSDRVYMKSSLLERECERFEDAISLIEEGLLKYPKFAKLYMMGGQICSQELIASTLTNNDKKQNLDRARKFYQRGLQNCANNVILWILASRLEESVGFLTKARSLLELGRLKNPKNPSLWLEAIRLESRDNNDKLAVTLMARALQECPQSGLLLAENISIAPRAEQKAKAADAIKKCPDDPLVIIAVASLFASERKVEKARKWFQRGVILNQDIGDSWAKYYAFEKEVGDEEKQKAVKDQCVSADPKHGELWCMIMKDMKNRKLTIVEGLELVATHIAKQKLLIN